MAQLIEYLVDTGGLPEAEAVYQRAPREQIPDISLVDFSMAKAYLNKGLSRRAGEILDQITAPAGANDAMELALLYKRAGEMQKAHNVFESNYDVLMNDPKAVHEYAQTKMKLAARIRRDAVTKRRINEEAAELLRRAIQLADNPTRQA
jgi:ATP-dependent DNA helicase RecG